MRKGFGNLRAADWVNSCARFAAHAGAQSLPGLKVEEESSFARRPGWTVEGGCGVGVVGNVAAVWLEMGKHE